MMEEPGTNSTCACGPVQLWTRHAVTALTIPSATHPCGPDAQPIGNLRGQKSLGNYAVGRKLK
jgi:hypothetical protein